MPSRADLHALLVQKLGSNNVYFQPPESLKMQYPAIVYNRNDISIRHANDKPYLHNKQYEITVIDKDPDSDIPDKIANIPHCKFNRHFVSNNLYHDIFIIYY